MELFLFLDLVRNRLGFRILPPSPENELGRQQNAEQGQREDLERLNEQGNGDRIVAADPELLGHQRVSELEETNVAGCGAQYEADVDREQASQASGDRNTYVRRFGSERKGDELQRPTGKRERHRSKKARAGREVTCRAGESDEIGLHLSPKSRRRRSPRSYVPRFRVAGRVHEKRQQRDNHHQQRNGGNLPRLELGG